MMKQMNMTAQTRHFLLLPQGDIREFSTEQAALVAAGNRKLPEFADLRLRYLQVAISQDPNEDLKVQTAGACISFDHDGRLKEAGPPGKDNEQITRFEHDACVQWALKSLPVAPITFH